jgi:CRISPR/Cas system-associated exonuclease Cas4 (RecB family)
VQQVSLYRLVLAEHGVTVDTAEIVYMDMREQLRIPVELLPLDEAWKLIEQRLALFTTNSLPDILHDPEEFWECDFCPVRGVCERLYGAPVGKSLVGEEAA